MYELPREWAFYLNDSFQGWATFVCCVLPEKISSMEIIFDRVKSVKVQKWIFGCASTMQPAY